MVVFVVCSLCTIVRSLILSPRVPVFVIVLVKLVGVIVVIGLL